MADGKGKMFVNLTDQDQMVEFDARARTILHAWSLAPGEGHLDRQSTGSIAVCFTLAITS